MTNKSSQQICSRPQTVASHRPALDQIHSSIQRLNLLLREESRTPAPHTCFSFAASAQIFSVIARAAAVSQDGPIVKETIALFSILLDSEADDFVAASLFARSMMRFAGRVLDLRSPLSGGDIEAEVIELLFGVIAKIRAQPHVLPVWFTATVRADPDDNTATEKKTFAGVTHKDDFPLCYMLIDRIHHEGRTGDFARTGLLYIFEAVSRSPALEDWIVGSDIPTLMASGLGALYSQLSRELTISHDQANLPMMLALSDYAELQKPSSAESIFSTLYAGHMSTFLSHLAFWQDVLEHCKSTDLKQTLLDHFQVLFLQQLLYPSLHQSSDTDAGSSVAVLTYLATILESLDHPDLVHMMLHYLLAMPETEKRPSMAPRSPTATKRQNSLVLLSEARAEEEKLEPNLFSLVDLMLSGITSQNPQTAVAALKLSSVMLTRHRNYAIATLVRPKYISSSDQRRTAGALSIEIENLFQLAARIGCHIDIDDAYAAATQDIAVPLEVQLVQQADDHSGPGSGFVVPMQTIASEDPYLTAILDSFKSFFTNSVDVNLALTEALTNLALCSSIGLEGWLAYPPSSYQFNPEPLPHTKSGTGSMDEEEASALRKLLLMQRRPQWKGDQPPALVLLLQSLNVQLDAIRLTVMNIDELIAKRMEILGGIDNDDRHSTVSSRLSSDFNVVNGARSLRIGEPRQVRQLRGQSSEQASSRGSSISPSRLSPSYPPDVINPPPRTREDSFKLPMRLSSLSKTSQERTHHSIFQPPPPDSPEEELSFDNRTLQAGRENEAETLRRRLRFHLADEAGARVQEFVPEHNHAITELDWANVKDVSLSHVLTNVVLLHHFVLELAAVMQTRAVVFEEVIFV